MTKSYQELTNWQEKGGYYIKKTKVNNSDQYHQFGKKRGKRGGEKNGKRGSLKLEKRFTDSPNWFIVGREK